MAGGRFIISLFVLYIQSRFGQRVAGICLIYASCNFRPAINLCDEMNKDGYAGNKMKHDIKGMNNICENLTGLVGI